MKVVLAIIGLALFVAVQSKEFQCNSGAPAIAEQRWVTMEQSCIDMVKAQVTTELRASVAYLQMAVHFSRDVKNRPGFAKMFFESANEERDHAIKLIKYLLMRGEVNIEGLIKSPYLKGEMVIGSGWEALKTALELETDVTEKITKIIEECEGQTEKKKLKKNDYHLVDYLTGEFLEEQYKSQKDLADKLLTLEKMNSTFGDLGEYLFDKKLLNEEIPVLF